MYKNVRISVVVIALLWLAGCGYRPVSHMSRSLFSQPLYLEVTLSRKNPESGLFLTDAMREAVRYRLAGKLTDDPQADERLKVSYRVVSLDALGYDTHGYVERYRVKLETHFDLLRQKKHLVATIQTIEEADVTPSALESSSAKREAIKSCAVKAVDQFIAFVAAKSMGSK